MPGLASWDDFIAGETAHAAHGAHAVAAYGDPAEIVEVVADFVAAGFAAGEPVCLVVRQERCAPLAEALARRGWDERALAAVALTAVDAEAVLPSLLVDGRLSAAAFRATAVGLVERAFAGRHGRLYGDMVDLLASQGRLREAIELEELWNGLLKEHSASLLCSYQVDVFDPEAQREALPEICRVHSHVLPAQDPGAFSEAVERALQEVLGPAKAEEILYIVTRPLRSERVPVAQEALRFLVAQLPEKAEAVLARARRAYEHAQTRPATA